MSRSPYLIVAVTVAALAVIGFVAPGSSLLPGLLFWAALIQGAVALAAVGELTRAKWIAPIRATLLGLHPLLLVFPFGFLIYARSLAAEPVAPAPIGWLQPGFLIARNVALLLATWILALLYARSAERGAANRRLLAGLYAVTFVVNQTFIAFDWVMALEYPWVSTLFGGYFFVEALYAGIALAAFAAAARVRREGAVHRTMLRDASTLLFGFSLLWAGQFFAQYLVIWYGNLPNEVSFLVRRLDASPLHQLSTMVLVCMFFVPFVILLSRSAKTSPATTTAMGIVILVGILTERLVFLMPLLPLNGIAVALAFLALGGAFVLRYRRCLAESVTIA